jgi:TolA-binding protein
MKQISFLFLFVLIIGLSSCNIEMQKEQELITGMEKAVEKNTSDQFVRPLVANYIKYTVNYPEDEMTPIYLYRCAALYYRIGNMDEAAINLEAIIRDYPEVDIIEDTYLFLAMVYTTGDKNLKRAGEIYKLYQEKYPTGKGVDKANYFFKPKSEKIVERIETLQQEMENLPRGVDPSESQYNQLMFTYIQYVEEKPGDPLSAAYCMQAARLAIRLGYHLIAIQLLEEIKEDYPTYDLYPEALLLLAVEYDTNIKLHLKKDKVPFCNINQHMTKKGLEKKDLVAEGGKIYRQILKEYPEHEVAVSAKAGLKNLGKKTAKVMEEFLAEQDSIQRAYKANR